MYPLPDPALKKALVNCSCVFGEARLVSAIHILTNSIHWYRTFMACVNIIKTHNKHGFWEATLCVLIQSRTIISGRNAIPLIAS